MGDRISMSISIDFCLDETLNQGPLALLLQRQYEFPFSAIFIFQFSFSKTENVESLIVLPFNEDIGYKLKLCILVQYQIVEFLYTNRLS